MSNLPSNNLEPRRPEPDGRAGVVRACLTVAAGTAATLIGLVSTLAAAGALGAAIAVVYAIIAIVIGALAIAGVYVWRRS